MKKTSNFAINKIWGHSDHTTSTLHLNPRQLNPTETYLYDLLLQDIITDIDIWVYGLENREKIKAVITNMNTMCNPTILAITRFSV